MKIKVSYIPCLFDETTWIKFESRNETVISIFMSLFQKYPEVRKDPPYITVRVNGEKVHPLKWGTPLRDGDEITIIQEIGWEAITLVWGFLTAGVTGGLGYGAVATAAAQLLFYVASIAYTIYSYATASHAPKTGGGLNSSPTYGWDGLQMQVRQGVAVPIVYGEHLLGGNLIEAFISSVADKNYLNLLIALSEGPISGIMKEDLSGVCATLPIKAVGTISMSGIALEDETFIIDTRSYYWTPSRYGAGMASIGTTAAEACTNLITAISADFSNLSATQGAGNTVIITALDGGVAGNSIDFSENSTNMTMNGGGHLGGTTAGVDGDTPYILINDNLLSNFKGVSWDYRLGTHNQTQIAEFGDVCQIYSMAGLKITDTPYVYTTVDSDVEAFELRFRIPALFASHHGNYYPVTTAATIEHKLSGGATWINDGEFSVTASSQQPIRRSFRKDKLAAGQYDIRVTRTAATYIPANPNWIEAMYLDNVTEVKYDTLTYPLTALLAVKVLATEQLSGQLPNVLTRIRGREVLNLDTSVIAWTSNPIYCVNNLMVNSRYGTGDYITQSNVNNDQLILMADHCDEIVGSGSRDCDLCDGVFDAINATSLTDNDHTFVAADVGKYISVISLADSTLYANLLITSILATTATGAAGWKLSDGSAAGLPAIAGNKWEWGEKRYQLDLVIDSQNPAFDTINQVCGSFRASPIWSKDAIQLLIDKKTSPSYIFTMGNVIDGSFRHTFQSEKSKPNSIQVDYADKLKKFQKETVDVIDYTAITGGTPIRSRRMSLLGASRQSQIYREGRYHLYAPKYQDEQVIFKGGIDAIHMLPGDVTKLQHDVFQWGYGGRVVSATTTAVTLDQDITFGDGTYVITCKLTNDTLETRTITTEFVSNPGFETLGGGGTDVFASWVESTYGTSVITADTANEHSGTYCAKLAIDAVGLLAYLMGDVTLVAGATYTLSFWYKNSIAGKTCRPDFRNLAGTKFLKDDGTWITSPPYITWFTCPNSLTWAKYSVTFVASEGTAYQLYLTGILDAYADTSGSDVYFDDVSIKPVDTVSVSVAFTTAPPVFGLYAIGLTGVEAKPFRIMSVLKTPENEIEVVATEYSDNVYTDTGIVIAEPVYSALPPNSEFPSPRDIPNPLVPPEVTNLVLAETTDAIGINITYDIPASTTNWDHGEIFISSDGGATYSSITTFNIDAPFIFRNVFAGVTYWIKIVSYSTAGVAGTAPPTSSIVMAGITPNVPTLLTAKAGFDFIVLNWTNPAPSVFGGYTEIKRSFNNSWAAGLVIGTVAGNSYWDKLGTYNTECWYWIRSKNNNGGYSTTWEPVHTGAGAYAKTTQIATADIGTFAITASQIHTNIPIITGDTWTNNSPIAGYVAWNSHTVVHNGASNTITASNTALKYIYWKAPRTGTANAAVSTAATTLTDTRLSMVVNQYAGDIITCNSKTMTIVSNTATIFTGASWSGGGSPGNGFAWSLNTGALYYKSATHPSATMGDTDFIIAVNISGYHDLAWNAIANQVIGSAWIQDAAITNAKILDAAITTAKIGNLQVQTAQIDNLTVGTGKITDNAASVPTATYTETVLNLPTNVWTEIQRVSLTTGGVGFNVASPIFITASAFFYIALYWFDLKITRAGTDAVEWDRWLKTGLYQVAGAPSLVCFNFSDLPGVADTWIYRFYARPTLSTASVTNRSLMAQCIKK